MTAKYYFSIKELPLEVQESEDLIPGDDWDYSGYLLVTFNDRSYQLFSDRMEPEDATFGRDLRWIAPLLQRVAKDGPE